MQTANELHESGLYEYAEPNLIHFIELSTKQYARNTADCGGTLINVLLKCN